MTLLHALAVAFMLFAGVGNARGEAPYRFGPLAPRLTPEELSAIATAAGVEPWAMLGWYSQVLPEVRYVDAFLPATVSTQKLRKGSVAHLQCKPVAEKTTCLPWTKEPEQGTYVQVFVGPRSHELGYEVRSPSERPIRVTGKFSDSDLLELVTYIRSGPHPVFSGGRVGMSVSVDLPIQDIAAQSDGSVWVRLTHDGGTGETATVVRARGRWHIKNVVGWVA